MVTLMALMPAAPAAALRGLGRRLGLVVPAAPAAALAARMPGGVQAGGRGDGVVARLVDGRLDLGEVDLGVRR
jgi:hypothetical protein